MYSIKKGVLSNFSKFTGTPVPELFFNTVAGLGQVTLAQVFSSSILQHL